MKRFQGRTVLITGAGSGIGRATAERFGSEGAAVVCADVNAKGVEETATTIRSQGGEALGLVCDVSSAPAVEETFAQYLAKWQSGGATDMNAGLSDVDKQIDNLISLAG